MLVSSKTLHLAGTRKLRSRFVDLSGCWSMLGGLLIDWISGGDSKMFTMSSTSSSFASTPREAHLQTHPSQFKLKVKNTSR